ncbi:sulfatase-like hydrolase/transferase [Haliscomenobacter sp.]|uniref:sulfatase-like hydrolase/transferase n=1 Tax=Haliscomenobacter sp. TaxID=2717303 RepID=UPI0035946F74
MTAKILFLLCLLCTTISLFAQRNVILIIADDLGSDYCGFYENHVDTAKMPNIRRLLARGVRFRNAWSNPLCSPTRAGILTGRYSFRTGVGTAVGGSSPVLDTSEITIPKLLNKYAPGGYAKANVGKWHLQNPVPANYLLPNKMGYDHYEGNLAGGVTSYTNWTKVKNGVASNVTTYATTETTNNAITWVKNQGNKPFFLWLAYNAPHTPHHLPPNNLHSSSNLSGTAAHIAANPESYFKAAVEALDHEIGRLFDSLQKLNLWDNTDIIFIGDNGDDPTVAQRSGGNKGSIAQGGVSVPFIIAGPSVNNPGRVSDALVSTQDLFATILELLGHNNWAAQIPSNKPVDSKSIVPILKNQSSSIRSWIFTEVFRTPSVAADGKAMRNVEYKLLDLDNGTQAFYHLASDPYETNDLLEKPLDAIAQSNYNTLCAEMSNLVGKGGFCSLTTATLEPLVKADPLEIYPNPVTDYFNIKNTTPDASYQIWNINGQILYQGNNITRVNISSWPAGVYSLAILRAQQKQIVRFVKK